MDDDMNETNAPANFIDGKIMGIKTIYIICACIIVLMGSFCVMSLMGSTMTMRSGMYGGYGGYGGGYYGY